MHIGQPSRLRTSRTPLITWQRTPDDDGSWSDFVVGRSFIRRRLRVVRRMVLLILWTLPCLLVQSILTRLPTRADRGFSRIYWAGMCAVLGLRVRVIGTDARGDSGRPVVYVSNHSSWLDVLALGARLEASFIAKEDVTRWPVVSWIARLGRTVYVRRTRASTARERDDMRARLAGGDSLILFPEGTTSDGSRVLPFRSAFLSVAELAVTRDGKPPLVQPVSIVYDRLADLPAGRASRPLFAWYGDMDLASHFWRLGQEQGLRATILLHAPLDPLNFPSRKALTEATWTAAAQGAATLRQNRPAGPS
jgi:1-acyl-sn-glycerol-3-phosphate acyltransferase